MTTCDYYQKTLDGINIETKSSINVSFYHLLNNYKLFTQNETISSSKYYVQNIIENINYLKNKIFYRHNKRNIKQTEILFQYQYSTNNYFGIQKVFAQKAKEFGFRSSILLKTNIDIDVDLFQKVEENITYFKIDKNRKDILLKEAETIIKYLKKYYFPTINSTTLVQILYRVALKIEYLVEIKINSLKVLQPKLVVVMNTKGIDESALLIAADKLKIKTLFLPHGFPQKSIAPINSSFIAAYGEKHHFYLDSLKGNYNSSIYSFGWLEPLVTLNQERKYTGLKNKYTVLFLSQIGGYKIQRAESLYQLVPKVLDALENIDIIDKVLFRLREYEVDSSEIKSLSLDKYKKIELIIDEPIESSLSKSNMLISFSSTGLLYAPYLNIKGIEIRDKEIDDTWGGRVLSETNIFYVGSDGFNNDVFEKFILDAPILYGKDFFHNYKNELNIEVFNNLLNNKRKELY